MARARRDSCPRYLRLLVLLCLGAAGLVGAGPGRALTRAELYEATVPVPDRSEASKPAAFEAALKAVLVRVTGRRSADTDPGLAPLIADARRYVQQYRDAQDGELWVAFDAAAIDRWLAQHDQPLWGRERPSTFVWLTVATGPQAGSVVTAEEHSEIKAAVDAAATLRGAPVVWPTAADLQREHLDFAAVNAASAATLADIAHRAGSGGTLIGHAGAPGAVQPIRWTFLYQDRSGDFSGPAAEGINRAADTYAGLFAVTGAAAPVVIEVAGVNDLPDYAYVQGYLESLAFISHVGVEALSGDTVRFRLTTRGGAEPLQNALVLSGRLQPQGAAGDGVQRFQLHH